MDSLARSSCCIFDLYIAISRIEVPGRRGSESWGRNVNVVPVDVGPARFASGFERIRSRAEGVIVVERDWRV
jgi:hypothetical protein